MLSFSIEGRWNMIAVFMSLKIETKTWEVSALKFWNSFEAKVSRGIIVLLLRLFSSIYLDTEAPKTENKALRA